MSAELLQPRALHDRSSSMPDLLSRQREKSHYLSARQCRALAPGQICERIELTRDLVSDRHATIDFECEDRDTACGCICWPAMSMTRQHLWRTGTGCGRIWTKMDRDWCKDGTWHNNVVHELPDALPGAWERALHCCVRFHPCINHGPFWSKSFHILFQSGICVVVSWAWRANICIHRRCHDPCTRNQ
jgi:hypothetical protein